MDDYLPILILIILAFLFASISFVASALLAPRKRPTAAKIAPYECGIVPGIDPPTRFPVRFYLVAMIFLVFDVEVLFLIPWVTIFTRNAYNALGLAPVVAYGALFGSVLVFSAIILVAYLYAWGKGVLKWD